MQLSKQHISKIIPQEGLEIPSETIFSLPEKVLQFGTGVLLRALPDYFIDKANKQGVFNGRIVVVKSTESDSSAFDRQDGLFTICIRGVERGNVVTENSINASISRVLSAKTEWDKILLCAHNPELTVIISNTTEVGIQLVDDNIRDTPPVSFPGKLLAFLFERYLAFNGLPSSGLVILPTELIADNGKTLQSILQTLAKQHNLSEAFIHWMNHSNTFCNTLVDRIVPGKPNSSEVAKIQDDLGYTDELLTVSEVFRLWAIEGDEKVKAVLSFYQADDGVKIVPDIMMFKELKIRLLNATHTLMCGTAFLSGFDLTRTSTLDPIFGAFTKKLMQSEIAPAIPYLIDEKLKITFAESVIDRFANPAVDHAWQSVALQYSSKMKMRCLPLLTQHYTFSQEPPVLFATCFAAFLLYVKAVKSENGKFFGVSNGLEYEIKDDNAGYFYSIWSANTPQTVVDIILRNSDLWGAPLHLLPGFQNMVIQQLISFLQNGVAKTVEELV